MTNPGTHHRKAFWISGAAFALFAAMLAVVAGAAGCMPSTASDPHSTEAVMPESTQAVKKAAFVLPDLPFDKNALEPHISAETLEYHWGRHHNAYVTNLNNLVAGTALEGKTLEEIIMSSDGGVFNNAAQVWNHTFYWHCMKKDGGGRPAGKLAEAIDRDFGSFDNFVKEFTAAATTQFGSGWAWLVLEDGKLKVTKTGNADLPMKHGQKAVLTIDVWEHAYYIDYRNARPKYIDTFVQNLVNWDVAAKNFGM